MTTLETIHTWRRWAMRDVVDVCIFLNGVNSAGEEICTDYVLTASPGFDPIQLFIEFSRGQAEALVEKTYYRDSDDTPNDDVRYELLTIVVNAGSECGGLEMLVDELKLENLDPDGIDRLLREIAEMLGQADNDGVKIADAVKAWEQERAAPAA
jgi:hypothetical protein